MKRGRSPLVLVAYLALSVGCDGNSEIDPGTDPGLETGTETGLDTGTDAGMDTGLDTGTDSSGTTDEDHGTAASAG